MLGYQPEVIPNPEELFRPGQRMIEITNIALDPSIPLEGLIDINTENKKGEKKRLIIQRDEMDATVSSTLRLETEAISQIAFPHIPSSSLNESLSQIRDDIFKNLENNILDLLSEYKDRMNGLGYHFSFQAISLNPESLLDPFSDSKTQRHFDYIEFTWKSPLLTPKEIQDQDTSENIGTHLHVLFLNELAERINTIAEKRIARKGEAFSIQLAEAPTRNNPLLELLHERGIATLFGRTPEGKPLHIEAEKSLTLRIPLINRHDDNGINSMPNNITQTIQSKLPGINVDVRLENELNNQYLYISVITEGYREYDYNRALLDTLNENKVLFVNLSIPEKKPLIAASKTT